MADITYYEDFVVGDSRQLGGRKITLEAITRFAHEFDPLPIHLDENAARDSIYKGVIASGLHTVAAVASVVVEEVLTTSAMTGSAGISELKWFKPVRPDDMVFVGFTVVETEPWAGRSNIGRVRVRLDATNQDQDEVMTALVDYLFLRRLP